MAMRTPTPPLATCTTMAVQERYFGTFFQRVLASPLDVRMHYGHPDLLSRIRKVQPGDL